MADRLEQHCPEEAGVDAHYPTHPVDFAANFHQVAEEGAVEAN